MPGHIEIIQNYDPSLPPIVADPGQLEQIFASIVGNAIQVMSLPAEACGAQLTLTSWSVPAPTGKMSTRPNPGQVLISIADTGVGIPKEHLDRIFEPIFTTKTNAMGLGLAKVKTLVEGHSGTIEVTSAPGQGAIFTITLPVYADALA